jgi:hypothetical protein
MRIKHRKSQHLRLELEFPRNSVKGRGVGNIPARTWCHNVTRHAAHFRQALAVGGIGSQRLRRDENCGEQ